MKRDWDLIRQILLKLEDKPGTTGVAHPNQFSGWDEETVSHHMDLLRQAGLIEATTKPGHNAPTFCLARNLTWAWHEFLDSIRSDTAWHRIDGVAKEKGIELSFDAIKRIAAYLIESVMVR